MVPKSTEPNDGKGAGTNQDNPFLPGYDPNGYLVVVEAQGKNFSQMSSTVPMGTWVAGGGAP